MCNSGRNGIEPLAEGIATDAAETGVRTLATISKQIKNFAELIVKKFSGLDSQIDSVCKETDAGGVGDARAGQKKIPVPFYSKLQDAYGAMK